jgi:hypothetical protein
MGSGLVSSGKGLGEETPGCLQWRRTGRDWFPVVHLRTTSFPPGRQQAKGGTKSMSILWIILIVVLVLALLGFFSRGRW